MVEALDMHGANQIRRWQRVRLCSLLCSLLWLAVHGFARAQTETSAPPKKPAHPSTTHTAKARNPGVTPANKNHTFTPPSAHTSAGIRAKKSKNSQGKKASKRVAS